MADKMNKVEMVTGSIFWVCFAVVVAGLLVFVLKPQVVARRAREAEARQLQQEVAQLRANTLRKQREVTAIQNDPFYIESKARDELNMRRADEIPYDSLPPRRFAP